MEFKVMPEKNYDRTIYIHKGHWKIKGLEYLGPKYMDRSTKRDNVQVKSRKTRVRFYVLSPGLTKHQHFYPLFPHNSLTILNINKITIFT